MKLFLALLLISSFIQSSVLPIDLCLVFIICYALITDYKSNLIVVFLGGILLSLLTVVNLGFWPIIFLLVLKSTTLIKKMPFATNFWLFVPAVFLISLGVNFLTMIFLGQSIEFLRIIFNTFAAIPIYFFFRFWEERFVVKHDIRLKLRN